MKKRALICVLLLAFILSVVACSSPRSPDPDISDSKESNETTPDNNINSSTESDDIHSPSEDGNKTVSLKEATPFSDGVAFVTIVKADTSTGVSEEYQALIDTTGAVLHKFSSDTFLTTPINYDFRYYNGVTYNEFTNTIHDNNYHVIASPENNGYDAIVTNTNIIAMGEKSWEVQEPVHDCGYFLVYKTEESFSGDKFYMGVLDSEGNYTVPLSDAHPIAALMAEEEMPFDAIEYVGNGYYSLGGYANDGYYNIVTNRITPNYPHYIWNEPNSGDFAYVDETGQITVLGQPDGEVYEVSSAQGDLRLFVSNGHYILTDATSNVPLIDFGDYTFNFSYEFSYCNGYFLAAVENPNGAVYCCLFDETGEPVFEPVRIEENSGDKLYELTNEGFIIKKDYVFYFYDYEGNAVAYDPQSEYTYMNGYRDGWALVIIETENWQYRYFFINSDGESLY